LCAGLLALASRTAAAQSAGQWQGPEHLWRAVCGYCHGTGIGVPLLGARLPAATIAEFTRKGLKQMPPFAPSQISDAELAALAEWISRSAPPPAAQESPK
jgi:mono/diheme cytochrome c family protein